MSSHCSPGHAQETRERDQSEQLDGRHRQGLPDSMSDGRGSDSPRSLNDGSIAEQPESPTLLDHDPHLDAIRARRSAIEQARQEALHKALAKKQRGDEVTDIASLEEQLATGGLSAVAALAVKKRLAGLKAVAIREERAAAAKARAKQAAAAADAPQQPCSPQSQSVPVSPMKAHASAADEMASLEAQLAGGQLSAATEVGLKKRLAVLKGNALREKRVAAAKLKAKAQAEELDAAVGAAARVAHAASEAAVAAAAAAAVTVSEEAERQATAHIARDEEILSLEEQLKSEGLRHADAVCMKKRLATLKAAAIRDQRVAASVSRTAHGGREPTMPSNPPSLKMTPLPSCDLAEETDVAENCEVPRTPVKPMRTGKVASATQPATLAPVPAVSGTPSSVDSTAATRDEEISLLEERLQSEGVRHADLISMKKRLANLKAAAIRDQRLAASVSRTANGGCEPTVPPNQPSPKITTLPSGDLAQEMDVAENCEVPRTPLNTAAKAPTRTRKVATLTQPATPIPVPAVSRTPSAATSTVPARGVSREDSTAATRDQEISRLEEQLQSEGVRHADLISMKKRLATLKAAAVRDQRVAASKARVSMRPRSPVSRLSEVEDPDSRLLPTPAVDPDFLPEPAVPPPRVDQHEYQGTVVPKLKIFTRSSADSPTSPATPPQREAGQLVRPRCGGGASFRDTADVQPSSKTPAFSRSAPMTPLPEPPFHRQGSEFYVSSGQNHRVSRKGAAAAPWANDWSNETA